MRRTRLLPRSVENGICEQLRATYDGVLREPVPDHFFDLLVGLETETILAFPIPDRQNESDASISSGPGALDSLSAIVHGRLKAS